MSIYCQLFGSFFRIGTFTIGGGYAMIPQMERELVDRHGWLSREEFMDLLTLSQTMPGVFAVNMAVSVGQRLGGVRGAVVSVVGNIAMPIAIILVLAMGIGQLRDNALVERVFMGVRPAVAALIAAPLFRLAKSARVSWRNVWIPLLAVLLICWVKISPVFVIVAAGLGGALRAALNKEEK